MDTDIPENLQRLYDLFSGRVGAHSDLGLSLLSVDGLSVRICMPFQQKHADELHSSRLHSSSLLTAIDSACGFAVMLSLTKPTAIATVNLRVDHICKPGEREDVVVDAFCYERSEDFAYVQAKAVSVQEERLFSNAVGVFKIGSPGPDLLSALV